MDIIYGKSQLSDPKRIAELFEGMLKTIYHTNDVEGCEDVSGAASQREGRTPEHLLPGFFFPRCDAQRCKRDHPGAGGVNLRSPEQKPNEQPGYPITGPEQEVYE